MPNSAKVLFLHFIFVLLIQVLSRTMDDKQLKNFYSSINTHLTFLNDVDLNADGDGSVKLITKTINQYSNSEFIKFCVSVINSISKNEFEFCRKLFEVSCALVKYRRDPEGHEIVMTPLLLIRVREGDCKKFTTWICAVLKCKGIESASKVVNYDSDCGWQHIYAIAWPKDYQDTKGYLVLDPVNHERFNNEVRYRIGRINFYNGTYSNLIMAKLSMMGNIPSTSNSADEILGDLEDISGNRRARVTHRCVQGMEEDFIHGTAYDSIEGAPDDDSSIAAKKNPAKAQKREAKKVQRKENKPARVEKRKKVFTKAKSAGFAPARAAFIGVILLGKALEKTPIKINLAKKLATLWLTDNGASIKAMWAKFGGKDDSLKKAIIKASNMQLAGLEEAGIGSAAATATLLAAASPLIIVTLKLLHAKKQIPKEEALRTIDATETATDDATDKNGNIKAFSDILKTSSKIVDEAIKIDQGGDKGAQNTIKTAPSTDTEGAPNNTKDESKASGFSLTNPSSYFNGALTVPLMGVATGYITTSAIVASALFITGAILSIKSFFKTI